MLEAVGDHYLISSESDFFNSCFSTNKKISNKRRFSDEQVKSLETMFESESKLEPRKKLELAKELGLQPRQVSIWFQNKRARWKSKQLERDYNVLQSNYDALSSRLESLKRENQSLVFQIKKLRELMEKDEEQVMARGTSGSDENSSSEGAMGVEVIEEYRGLCGQGDFGIDSDEGSSIKEEYIGIGLREEEIVKMEDTASLTSIDYWEGLEEGDNTSYNHLWDFWD